MSRTTLSIKRLGLASAVLLAAMSFGGAASAAGLVKCPDPMFVDTSGPPGPDTSQTRQYQTTGAVDCVWGNGNIGQGQPGNDAFLLSQGTNDALYGNLLTAGPQFSRTWTTIDSQDYNKTNGTLPDVTGLTITNLDGDSFDWVLTGNPAYASYALGLVDGLDPKWAVFLLSGTSGTAAISTDQGDWSHIVLYGSTDGGGTDDDVVPEPASLALVGLALTGLAISRRRGRKQ